MPYQTDETSIHDGEPIELYEFVGPVTSYLYTSHHVTVTHASKTYQPSSMSRTAVAGGAQGDVPVTQIKMPHDEAVITDNGYQIAPIGLFVTIRRLHTVTGESIIYWSGEVTDIIVNGRTALLNVPSILATAMTSSIPSVFFQGICNHVLYDSRCTQVRSSHKVSGTISSVSLDGTQIQLSTVGGNPDDTFRAGEIVIPANVERRLILRQSGTLLTINFPFRSLTGGDLFDMFKGCDHLPETCRDKFANIVNFGGHPFVPDFNLFIEGLK